jgi:hypothetical protein
VTFDAKLRQKLQSIHTKLTPEEATAIIDVARLAAAADKKTDLSETVVLLALSRIVCEMAGLKEVPQAPATIDAKRLHDIGEHLVPMGARELAYACAYTVMIQDLELTKEEDQLARSLGEALVIEAARAKQLASEMEAMIRSARAK